MLPPLWPWVQVVRTYLRENTEETLVRMFGTGVDEIALAIPEIREYLPAVSAPPQRDVSVERFRFFDSFPHFLKNLDHHQPVVIVLDDLHSADTSTHLLL